MKTRMGGGRKAITLLQVIVQNWQTPTSAAEAPNLGSNIKRGPKSLLAQAQWATPVASDDGRKVTSASLQPGLIGQATDFAGRLDPETTGRLSRNAYGRPRLNPTFVEGLMGWPIGWTDLAVLTGCESWATASSLHRQPMHGDSSGGSSALSGPVTNWTTPTAGDGAGGQTEPSEARRRGGGDRSLRVDAAQWQPPGDAA